MSTQNLSEFATRAQAGHMFDSVEGQFLNLPRAVMQNIVVTPGSLELYKAGHQRLVEELVAKHGMQLYPAIGQVFELTLDGDAPANQPLAMVRVFGYNPEGWRHMGHLLVKGQQTRRFKLDKVGSCPNLGAVREKLKVHGEIGGQWIVAFKAKYSQPDGQGPVGVADLSWSDPDGNARFPCVDTGGGLNFDWAGYGQVEGWRWLVPVK